MFSGVTTYLWDTSYNGIDILLSCYSNDLVFIKKKKERKKRKEILLLFVLTGKRDTEYFRRCTHRTKDFFILSKSEKLMGFFSVPGTTLPFGSNRVLKVIVKRTPPRMCSSSSIHNECSNQWWRNNYI